MEKVRILLGFKGLFVVDVQGHSGSLAFLWRFGDEASLMGFSKSHIDLEITISDTPSWQLTGMYGEPNRHLRHKTWDLLRDLSSEFALPWCIIGDHNNVLSHDNKRGGSPYSDWLLSGFQQVVDDCHLQDLEFVGYPFTWERGRGTPEWIEVRLDQALVSDAWLDLFPNYEVRKTLFQMHPDKAPGPDGMKPGFYQKCWDLVGGDVVAQVQNFFLTGVLPAGLNNTNVVLIPKKKYPSHMGDLRPISLCNVLLKVITKVLANRLKVVLPSVISKTQSAFLQGWLISDNIMVSFKSCII
uniref:Reverse transcriptase domain-containing protein n=1 Tax=Cannabis sativa TaxID=3483 RepID=A0A803PK80_CANSA